MQINFYPKEANVIPPYLAAYLIHANQVGIGVLGFQRMVAKESGQDAWISVLFAGLLCHLTVWVMFRILRKYPSADLYGIHADVFGKWLGGLFSSCMIVYSIFAAMVVLRNYVEVVQTWMFPEVSISTVSLIILFLAMYTLLGGIRVVAGYTFLTVTLLLTLIFTMYFPLQYARWDYLFPVLEADVGQLWNGTVTMSLTIIGFEVMYVLYPYVKKKERMGIAAQLAVAVTTLLYTLIMVVTLVYFSQGQLMKTIWATLAMQKMVSLPFIERFEFIAVSLWLFVILPNIMLYIWMACRGMKRVMGWNQKTTTYCVTCLIFLTSLVFMTRQQIDMLNKLFSTAGIVIAFVYPYLLYILVIIKQAWSGKKEAESHGAPE